MQNEKIQPAPDINPRPFEILTKHQNLNQDPVSEVSQILRRTIILICLLVGVCLVAVTILTSRFLYKWEIETINSVLVTARSPAMLAAASMDKIRGQALTDGLLSAKGIYRATLIDDYGEVLGHSAKKPPDISLLLGVAHLFWPQTTIQIESEINLYQDQYAKLIIDVVLGTSDEGLVEASLQVLIMQAVLIAILTALTIHWTTTQPVFNGLRVLSEWVKNSSTNRITHLPAPGKFKVAELYENATFIKDTLSDLFQQKQALSRTVGDLEVQVNLNEKYIRIINQILANTHQMAVHMSASGNTTIYNKDGALLPYYACISPKLFLQGPDTFIEELKNHDRVRSVTQVTDVSVQSKNSKSLLMDIDATFENDSIIQITGFELGKDEHALMLSDRTQARAFANENFQRQKLESLGVLSSGVAHDLNNILAIISGSLEMELNRNIDTEARSNLSAAFTALQHGASVVRTLLRFSRKNAEQAETQTVKDIIEDLLLLVQGKIGGEIKIESTINVPSACVEVNRSSLANALLNLAINARDAIGGKGRIDIISRNATQADDLPKNGRPEDFVVFEVRDDGPGIPEELRARILDPFFTTKSRDKGTGLGLTLVYNVAESNGGKLSFTNVQNAGAAFMIALPKAKPIHKSAAPEIINPVTAPPLAKGRILIVDDEEQLAALSCKYLTAKGHEVVTANSVTEFKKVVSDDTRFDVVLTDLNLGDGTGYDVAEHIQKLPNPPPIVLSSGNIHYGASEEPMELFDDFLEKPFALTDLLEIVAKVMKEKPKTDLVLETQ